MHKLEPGELSCPKLIRDWQEMTQGEFHWRVGRAIELKSPISLAHLSRPNLACDAVGPLFRTSPSSTIQPMSILFAKRVKEIESYPKRMRKAPNKSPL